MPLYNPPGVTGPQGPTGPQGIQGVTGPAGPGGGSGGGSSSGIYVSVSGATLGLFNNISFTGAGGISGWASGPIANIWVGGGAQGVTGATGPTGPQGPQGIGGTGIPGTSPNNVITFTGMTMTTGTFPFTAIPSSIMNIQVAATGPIIWEFDGSIAASNGTGVIPSDLSFRVVVDGNPGPQARVSTVTGPSKVAAKFIASAGSGNHTGWVEWQRGTGFRTVLLTDATFDVIALQGVAGPTGYPGAPGATGPGSNDGLIAGYSMAGVTGGNLTVTAGRTTNQVLSISKTKIFTDQIDFNTTATGWNNLLAFSLDDNATGATGTINHIDAIINAMEVAPTGGGNAGVFKLSHDIKRFVGTSIGVPSGQAAQLLYQQITYTGWTATLTFSGPTGVVQVNSQSTHTINWGAMIQRTRTTI
jgi:hypothetical protein